MLRLGDMAPGFSATVSTGEMFSLSESCAAGPVILYFYPRDFTTGCTLEAKHFRDAYDEIRSRRATIVGISDDSGETHERFRASCGLPFPLIVDTGRSVARLYGAVWFGNLGVRRVTYVIDRQQVIRGIVHHEIRIHKHVAGVLAFLDEMRP